MQWLLASDVEPMWGIFVKGWTSTFLLAVIFFAVVYVMIMRARAGAPVREIRRLPGIDAVAEAVGRATEMGAPVIFHPGRGDLRTAETISMFAMLAYTASLCARYDTRIVQMHWQPVVMAVCEEITRQAYLEAGRPDSFNPDDIQFVANHEAVAMGKIEKERPGAQIFWGQFFSEAMNLIEIGAMTGAIQVGAATQQLPWFVAACDYTLIGEEMYAAGAYLSKEPVLVGTIVGQDLYKMGLMALILLGALLTTILGHSDHFINDWLRL